MMLLKVTALLLIVCASVSPEEFESVLEGADPQVDGSLSFDKRGKSHFYGQYKGGGPCSKGKGRPKGGPLSVKTWSKGKGRPKVVKCTFAKRNEECPIDSIPKFTCRRCPKICCPISSGSFKMYVPRYLINWAWYQKHFNIKSKEEIRPWMVIWYWWVKFNHGLKCKYTVQDFENAFGSKTFNREFWAIILSKSKNSRYFAKWFPRFWKKTHLGEGGFQWESFLEDYGSGYIDLTWYRSNKFDISSKEEIRPWMIIWCWWIKSNSGDEYSKEDFQDAFGSKSFDIKFWKRIRSKAKHDLDFAKWFPWFWWKITHGGNFIASWVWKICDPDWLYKNGMTTIKGGEGGFQWESFLEDYGSGYIDLTWYQNNKIDISSEEEIRPWMIIWCWWIKSNSGDEFSKEDFQDAFDSKKFDFDLWSSIRETPNLKYDPNFVNWFAWFWWKVTHRGNFVANWVWKVCDLDWLHEKGITATKEGEGGFDWESFLEVYGTSYSDLNWYINNVGISKKEDIKPWMIVWCWWVKSSASSEFTIQDFERAFGSKDFDISRWNIIRHKPNLTYDPSFVKWFAWYWWMVTNDGGEISDGSWIWTVCDNNWLFNEGLTVVRYFDWLKFLAKYGVEYTDVNWYKNRGVVINSKEHIENWMIIWCWWLKTTDNDQPTKDEFKTMFGGNNFDEEWFLDKYKNSEKYLNLDQNFLNWFGWYWMKKTHGGLGKYKADWVWTVCNYQWIYNEKLTTLKRSFLVRFLDVEGPGYIDVSWYQENGEVIRTQRGIRAWMVIWCWYKKSSSNDSPSKEEFENMYGKQSFDEKWFSNAKQDSNLNTLDPDFVKYFGWLWWKATSIRNEIYTPNWTWKVSDNTWLYERKWTKVKM